MTRTTRVILTAGAVAVAGAALGHAAGPHRGGLGSGARLEWLSRKLGLAPEQATRIRAIEDRKVREVIEVHGQIEYARHELGRLLAAEAPERGKVMARIDELARLHGEARKVEIGARLDQREVLTPEQRERLLDLAATRGARRGARGHRHGSPDAVPPPEEEPPLPPAEGGEGEF